jgi:hypothetical protein
MGFLDEVQAEQSARQAPQTICRVKRWLATQSDDVRADFETAMDDTDKYTATAILKVMKSYPSDVDINLNSVQRHRRKNDCSCFRDAS